MAQAVNPAIADTAVMHDGLLLLMMHVNRERSTDLTCSSLHCSSNVVSAVSESFRKQATKSTRIASMGFR